MRGTKAKKIRKAIGYKNTKRSYARKEDGSIVADRARNAYQKLKGIK